MTALPKGTRGSAGSAFDCGYDGMRYDRHFSHFSPGARDADRPAVHRAVPHDEDLACPKSRAPSRDHVVCPALSSSLSLCLGHLTSARVCGIGLRLSDTQSLSPDHPRRLKCSENWTISPHSTDGLYLASEYNLFIFLVSSSRVGEKRTVSGFRAQTRFQPPVLCEPRCVSSTARPPPLSWAGLPTPSVTPPSSKLVPAPLRCQGTHLPLVQTSLPPLLLKTLV